MDEEREEEDFSLMGEHEEEDENAGEDEGEKENNTPSISSLGDAAANPGDLVEPAAVIVGEGGDGLRRLVLSNSGHCFERICKYNDYGFFGLAKGRGSPAFPKCYYGFEAKIDSQHYPAVIGDLFVDTDSRETIIFCLFQSERKTTNMYSILLIKVIGMMATRWKGRTSSE